MRWSWLLAAVIVAGCTGGDPTSSSGPEATGPAPTPAATTTDPGPDTTVGVDPTVPPTLPGPDDLTLPGLLDITDGPLPDDPAVRSGQLPNGLVYAVRQNDNPGSKAELRLVIDAGSADETGPVTGVAHFVEHMLFNGTERFPENDLIATLRSFGAAFGADVNARTGYDATVYELSVPNDDPTVELGLGILEQWLSHATIDEQQVVAERGVVLDEWRIRTQSAGGRLFAGTAPMFLAGTPADGHPPVGDEASIAAMSVADLRDFYDRHYRPDNAAVVVVGDIDVDEVVATIEDLFGPAVPRSDGPAPDTSYTFPIDVVPEALVHLDPDQPTADVEVTFPLGRTPPTSTAGRRAELLDAIALDILERRLAADLVTGTAPFDEISPGSNSYVAGLSAPGLYAVTDADRVVPTLQALLDEFERARRFGFTPSELDVAREAVRAGYRTRYDGRDSAQDRAYAEQYVQHFLLGTGRSSIDDEYAAVTAILDAVTVEAVELRYRTRLANTAPHVVIAAPQADGDRIPDEAEVLAIVAAVPGRGLDDRAPLRDLPDELMPAPEPVEPIETAEVIERGSDLFDPRRLVFANGVTVVLNSNRIVEGQVYLEAASRGGSSLVDDADVVDALFAAEVVTSSGVGDFGPAEVDRILAGADVSFDAWIRPYSEHLSGTVATADLESLFQLIHLSMTAPRVDEVVLDQIRNGYRPLVEDPGSDPGLVATDTLLDTLHPGELRYAVLPTPEEFAGLDPDGVERVWTDRFRNADGWVFVLSGDLDLDVATRLAASYLGTLPPGAPEEPVDVGSPPPTEVVRVEASAGTGDTASVVLSFTTPVDDVTARLRVVAEVANAVLDARLVDVVREAAGETYSPSAWISVDLDPDPVVATSVTVTGAPDRVRALGDVVVAEIARLADGVPPDEFDRAYAQVDERYGFVDNGQFLTELLRSELDPAWDLDDYRDREAALAAIGPDAVAAFIRAHLPVDRYVQVTVTPR